MLATTHIMVANKATSEKGRMVLGEAMMAMSSRQGNMMKACMKENARRKLLVEAEKVWY